MLGLFVLARNGLAVYGLITLLLSFWQQRARRNQEKIHVELLAKISKASEEFRRISSLRASQEVLNVGFSFGFDARLAPTKEQLYPIIYCWTVSERQELARYLADVPEYLHQLPVPPRLQEIRGADGRPWWDQKKLELLWSQDVPEHAVSSGVAISSENRGDVSTAATDIRSTGEPRASDSVAGDRPLDGGGC